MVDVARGHQRADTLTPSSQKTSQSGYTDHSLSNSVKLSHAVWGHPGQAAHGRAVWQNVVRWGRDHFSILALRTPWTVWKGKMIGFWEELPGPVCAQYATGDQWRNNSRKNEGMKPKQKEYPAVDVTGDRSKVRCCKKQYCIETWNVRSMNQGKLEVGKQEMASVNINNLESAN